MMCLEPPCCAWSSSDVPGAPLLRMEHPWCTWNPLLSLELPWCAGSHPCCVWSSTYELGGPLLHLEPADTLYLEPAATMRLEPSPRLDSVDHCLRVVWPKRCAWRYMLRLEPALQRLRHLCCAWSPPAAEPSWRLLSLDPWSLLLHCALRPSPTWAWIAMLRRSPTIRLKPAIQTTHIPIEYFVIENIKGHQGTSCLTTKHVRLYWLFSHNCLQHKCFCYLLLCAKWPSKPRKVSNSWTCVKCNVSCIKCYLLTVTCHLTITL